MNYTDKAIRRHLRFIAHSAGDMLMNAWSDEEVARCAAFVAKYGELPMVKTRSREAGNCKQGTEDWIHTHVPEGVKSMPLREVARLAGSSRYAWRAMAWTALQHSNMPDVIKTKAHGDTWWSSSSWNASVEASEWLDGITAAHKEAK